MHAFDLDALDGRRACASGVRRPARSLTTLDGVGADARAGHAGHRRREPAQAVAGVMGGAASEVSAATRTVVVRERVLQAGVGAPDQQAARPQDRSLVAVRARRRHQRAGRRAAARPRPDAADRRRAADRPDRRSLSRSRAARSRCTCGATRLARLLGLEVPDADVVRILHGARVSTVAPTADGWDVAAPTFRVDLLREVDLIEEVGRHYGFDKLEPAFPAMTAAGRAARSRGCRAISWCGVC